MILKMWMPALALAVLAQGAVAQSSKGKAEGLATDDPVLMTVDGKPVTRSEFEAIYKKNNKDAAVTKEALDEYMELFINYKLKVREAESLGMDTVKKFRDELSGYRTQLARPYLVDRNLNDQLMQEAYGRSQQEVRASHILVSCTPEASPEDTLKAYKKVVGLRDRVMAGEDFATVAKASSNDPSAAQNGGDLGYFSALQMVYPFETVAFSTPLGEVSKPVRTRFGYHVIKVVDKRPARGQVKVAHIMLRSPENDPAKEAEIEKKVQEVHALCVATPDQFADLALKYSEDSGSSAKGGELPMFGTGKMIEEFENESFKLTADGQISQPFKTRYGWHIVKRLEYQAPPTFEQAKGELKSKIQKDSRADITKRAFTAQLRKDYKYTPVTKNLKPVYALVDSTIFMKGSNISDTLLRRNVVEGPIMINGMRYRREINGALKNGKVVNIRSRQYQDIVADPNDTVVVRDIHEGWTPDAAKAKKLTQPLFSLNGRAWTQADFLSYLESKQARGKSEPIKNYVDSKFEGWVDESLMSYEDGRLEEKHPEFRMLMKEYRDGILLFELTDQQVWSKAVKDTAGLQSYYDGHATDFMHPVRYDADIYTCANAQVAEQTRKLLKKGKRGDELTAAVNKTSALNLDAETGRWSADEKPFLKGITTPGLSNNFDVDGRVVIVDMKQVVAPAPKTLDEARGLVTAAYQDRLEKDWIAQLRAKYKVVTDPDVLYSIR
ncbi:MAG: peptidylprolyl isomerase [Flavobacteriales bacterium]